VKAIKRKNILAALLCAAVVLTLPACGKKDKDSEEGDEAPELISEYPFGEQSVPGLMSDEPTAAVSASTTVTYSYTGLSSPGSAVQDYVSLMTGEENGFSVVDADFVISEEPKYGAEGSVLLARSAAPAEGEEDKDKDKDDGETEPEQAAKLLQLLDISWDLNGCVIVTREAEGEISQPPEGMTMHEAQEYLESLTPEMLGLEGESMDDYDVFTFDGTVIVDNRACVRMNVYSIDNVQQSNEFMGCYLMSLDGRHLYRLDTSTQEIVELQ